jgi:hypothetical protein
MTFSFTDVDIGNLLWNKQYSGLEVKGIFDESQISEFSRYEDLKDFSMIDKNKYKLHHKVFIIDNETVITGSYNPSRNANEFNDENLLIIHDTGVAEKYLREFFSLYTAEQKTPKTIRELIITKVVYDPEGGDEGNELVEIKNIGDDEINLQYYSIADNKTNMKLTGNLGHGEIIKIAPKFTLKNTNGMLFLKHNSEIIDYVYWEGVWKLTAFGDLALIREKPDSMSEDAWIVGKA